MPWQSLLLWSANERQMNFCSPHLLSRYSFTLGEKTEGLIVCMLVCSVNLLTSFSAHISEIYSLSISDTKTASLHHMAHSSDPDKTILFGFRCSSVLYSSVWKTFNSSSYTSCLQSSMALHIPTQFHPLRLVCSPSFTTTLLKCTEQPRMTALFQWSQRLKNSQYQHLTSILTWNGSL